MIPIDSAALYDLSLSIIRSTVGHRFLGRLVQMFLAAKHYGQQIPQIGDAVGIQSGDLEDLLDELYLKPSRPSPDKVAIVFKASHKVPSGQTDAAHSDPSNIWRNNLNLQKGYMCFGSHNELLDPSFRNPSRLECPHLVPAVPGSLAQAQCALNLGPRYRGEDHPKMFKKDAATGEYWIYDPRDLQFYSTIMLPDTGNKIPVAPLIIALYYDGKLAAGRAAVDISDFLSDFDFSSAEFATYFDADPSSTAHQQLLAANSSISWNQGAVVTATPSPPAGTLPAIPTPLPPSSNAAATSSVSTTSVTTSAPPATGHWWSAEQAVRTVLEADGWQVIDVTRLGIGYDFKATKAGVLRLVEVKSAVGRCAPTLTQREYREAKQARNLYVLAIVENFDPLKPVTIRWVQDPARLQMTVRNTTAFFLPRSVWQGPATGTFPV